MTSTRTRLAFAATTLALVVAACGGSSTTPSPAGSDTAASQAPSAAPTEAPTAAPTEVASAEPSAALPSDIPSFQLPSTDKELEALLPSTYEGETLQKFSISGADAAAQDKETADLLAGIGKTPADVSIAVAAGSGDVSFIAVRLRGADQASLQKLFDLAAQQSGAQTERISLAGRDVWKNIEGSDSGSTSYYYIKGDVAFGVNAPDDAAAGKALAVLP